MSAGIIVSGSDVFFLNQRRANIFGSQRTRTKMGNSVIYAPQKGHRWSRVEPAFFCRGANRRWLFFFDPLNESLSACDSGLWSWKKIIMRACHDQESQDGSWELVRQQLLRQFRARGVLWPLYEWSSLDFPTWKWHCAINRRDFLARTDQ